MDEVLNAKQLAQRMEVSPATVDKWRKAGCPRREDKKFNLVDVCRWLSDRAYRGKAKQIAWEILRAYQPPNEAENMPQTEPQELGISPALDRLRNAEAMAHQAWIDAHQSADPSVSNRHKEWQQCLEALRRMEQSLLDVLEQRRELLPAAEVKNWMASQIERSKAALLDVPAKIAPELEGMTWPQIQKRLREEISDALKQLSKNP